MTPYVILFLVFLVIFVGITYPGWRQKQILSKPFPPSWQSTIDQRLPFFQKLTASEQGQLKDMVKLFIAGKTFYGCDGLEMNDEIRVTIAAEACLLLLNRKTGIYPRLKHILVYPYAFRAGHDRHSPDGTVDTSERGLLGESWHYGKIILSWDDVDKGIRNFQDGQNVVLHEFSHQLDSESGSANGAPVLHSNSYTTWANILSKEFEELNKDFSNHHKSVMDYYGATNPAEFFAVATETFFEKPEKLKEKHPELFEVLRKYYALNPEDWH